MRMLNRTTQQILDLLKKHNVWYETFEHEPVRTSEEAAKVRPGYSLHQGAKALILKVYFKNKQEDFIMFVLAGDAKIDKKVLKEKLAIKNFRFASTEEVEKITNGVLPGGIPPFGNLFGLKTYADEGLLNNEKIVFNAGDRSFSIAMKLSDYLRVVKPIVLLDKNENLRKPSKF